MILTKITTLEFSVLTSVEASPELSLIPVMCLLRSKSSSVSEKV